ncbi:hypothetical protein DIS24_g9951 [Lasiodiplodia hormozganensis]|uniref:Uncharacterized protein n=1 Tax=Lasiodiplodia hormozganensis TaxID=869390 RepID=A0AA39XSG5_9PEZI|nr:hypothetical protein DIS24_g9951 [Lasiodiplodia hormozganensis]
MDGLGITFARSWAAKQKAATAQKISPPRKTSPSRKTSSEQPVSSAPSRKTSLEQPIPSAPSPELPQNDTSLRRSSTRSSASGDSYMEKRLSEFQEWKQKITEGFSIKKPAKTTFKEEPLPASEPSSPTQQSPMQLHTPPQTPPQQIIKKESTPARSYNNRTPPAVREKARILALRARALPEPDIKSHPAFRPQHIRVRKKTYATKTDVLKCWRPASGCASDNQLWECCEKMEVDSICEDCGYVLCPTCASRCRGEEWCVVEGCVRCQTRLGVNVCTPHLRELRAKPMERFHGHLVEASALFLIEKL